LGAGERGGDGGAGRGDPRRRPAAGVRPADGAAGRLPGEPESGGAGAVGDPAGDGAGELGAEGGGAAAGHPPRDAEREVDEIRDREAGVSGQGALAMAASETSAATLRSSSQTPRWYGSGTSMRSPSR